MLAPLWEYFYDLILNNLHVFIIPVNTFLRSPIDDKNNVDNISMRVSLLEKQD